MHKTTVSGRNGGAGCKRQPQKRFELPLKLSGTLRPSGATRLAPTLRLCRVREKGRCNGDWSGSCVRACSSAPGRSSKPMRLYRSTPSSALSFYQRCDVVLLGQLDRRGCRPLLALANLKQSCHLKLRNDVVFRLCADTGFNSYKSRHRLSAVGHSTLGPCAGQRAALAKVGFRLSNSTAVRFVSTTASARVKTIGLAHRPALRERGDRNVGCDIVEAIAQRGSLVVAGARKTPTASLFAVDS
jgi:hypothetical protein